MFGAFAGFTGTYSPTCRRQMPVFAEIAPNKIIKNKWKRKRMRTVWELMTDRTGKITSVHVVKIIHCLGDMEVPFLTKILTENICLLFRFYILYIRYSSAFYKFFYNIKQVKIWITNQKYMTMSKFTYFLKLSANTFS